MEFHKNAEPNSQLLMRWPSVAACLTGAVTVVAVYLPWYASMAWDTMIDARIPCPRGLSPLNGVHAALSLQSESGVSLIVNRAVVCKRSCLRSPL